MKLLKPLKILSFVFMIIFAGTSLVSAETCNQKLNSAGYNTNKTFEMETCLPWAIQHCAEQSHQESCNACANAGALSDAYYYEKNGSTKLTCEGQ